MNRPIIALDFKNKTEIENFLAHFPQDEQLYVKVGMEIFYKEGPQIVTWLKSLGHDIFLDLKLHDIPSNEKYCGIRCRNDKRPCCWWYGNDESRT